MSRLVSVEKPEFSKLVVKKSRGALTVDEVFDAFVENDIDDAYVLFIKRPEYVGFFDKDSCTSLILHNISNADNCPVCGKAWEEIMSKIYEEAYQYGYKTGIEEASNKD